MRCHILSLLLSVPDKDRWQTVGRLAAGGHAGNKGLVDEHSRVHSTDLHYFNRLLHVAENRCV